MSVSSKMAVVGGRVIRYVKATLSMFFINLLLKDISSTMICRYVENNYLNRLKFFFFDNFPVFYWLMARSARTQLPVSVDQFAKKGL